jgi:glycerate-2-kinase
MPVSASVTVNAVVIAGSTVSETAPGASTASQLVGSATISAVPGDVVQVVASGFAVTLNSTSVSIDELAP